MQLHLCASIFFAAMSIWVHNLVSQLRGCALEACFKQLAVAEHNNLVEEKPQYFYFKPDGDGGKKGRRVYNPRVVNFVWPLSKKLRAALRKKGFKLCFAQSTYHPKKVGCGTSFSVDLQVKRNAERLWLEVKYTDLATLNDARTRAGTKLELWRELLKTPTNWKLDQNLGGGALQVPSKLGTLVCSGEKWLLSVEGEADLEERFEAVPAPVRTQRRTQPQSEHTRLRKKASRQKRQRKAQRRVTQRGQVTRKEWLGSVRRLRSTRSRSGA